jgi:hypothetical protein
MIIGYTRPMLLAIGLYLLFLVVLGLVAWYIYERQR